MAEEQQASENTLPAETLEMRKYREELAKEYGLPSPFQTSVLKQMARDMVESAMVPSHFRSNPMAVYLAIVRGREMGMEPMESVLEAFWAAPGGKLGLYAAKMLDLMHRKKIKSKFLREDKDGCEILFTPPNDHEPYTGRFIFEEARTASLVKADSNWIKWPTDMCRARAISRAWRALAGVVGNGGATPYSKEELEDMDYETVAPAGNGSPEVQAPVAEKPAQPGKRPKSGTVVDVKPAESTATAATAATAGTAEPVKEPAPPPVKLRYYVISSLATLPALDKVEQKALDAMKIAEQVGEDLPASVKAADMFTKERGIEHYILTFNEGKAQKIHTSMPKQRDFFVVDQESFTKATSVAAMRKAAVKPPSHVQAVAEALATESAKWDPGKRTFLVVSHLEGESAVKLELTVNPPPAVAPEPPAPVVQSEAEPISPELLARKLKIKAYFESLRDSLQVPNSQRGPIVNRFIMAFLGLAEMKEFAADLDRAEVALNAMNKAMDENPGEFIAKSRELGVEYRKKYAASPVPTGPSAADNPVNELASYYAERGWTGPTTSAAEKWRRKSNLTAPTMRQTLQMSMIERCKNEDAYAYFQVANAYSVDTSTRFAIDLDGERYGEVLQQIRNAFDGAEVEAIPEDKFNEVLAREIAGGQDLGGLFGNEK